MEKDTLWKMVEEVLKTQEPIAVKNPEKQIGPRLIEMLNTILKHSKESLPQNPIIKEMKHPIDRCRFGDLVGILGAIKGAIEEEKRKEENEGTLTWG